MEFKGKKLRHEQKYFISMPEYWMLRGCVRTVLRPDSFHIGQDSYFIRSLYFDDMYDTSLYEKNAGIYEREKYRIRIYNLQSDVIKLECKQKYGEYVSKVSASLSLEEYRRIMAGDFAFLKSDTGLRGEFVQKISSERLRPSVIVDYDREAYVYGPGDVRITFDKDLRTGMNSNDIFSADTITNKALEPNQMILEVKFNEFLPGFIAEMLQNCARQNRSSISKYVICRVMKGNIY